MSSASRITRSASDQAPGFGFNIYSRGGIESVLLEEVGPVVEAGKEYQTQVFVAGGSIRVHVDGKLIGEVQEHLPFGKHPGFQVSGYGHGHIRKARLIDLRTDEVLFEDDFQKDSLVRKVPVEISELVSEEWIPAEVPGTVHSSLLAAGEIEDPYVGYHGPETKWIDGYRWIYRKKFHVPEHLEEKNLRLVFEGLDYHGYVWLNGELLGYHEGMFGGPEYEISRLVRRDQENELVVCLLPCPHPYESNVKPYILQRWHFNMDILTVGLWRPVKLVGYDNLILHSPQVVTRSIDDGRAILDVSVSLTSYAMYPFKISGKYTLESPCPDDAPIEIEFEPGFFNGTLKHEQTIEVPDPRLWWPNGMGEQNLYRLTIQAEVHEHHRSKEATGQSEISTTVGIRTLEKRPTPDASGKYDWILCVNGRPFFGKGSNWMPIDQMLRLDPDRYDRLLELARDSHINILRPWGAGLIETDEFFDLCDKYGICVWQEFLLANGYFKDMDRDVWRDTIVRNVTRLRNHPSIVVWCGGNEFDPDCDENRSIVDDLENLCADLDPTRDFHRASPHGGDSHSYQVNWMEGGNYTYFTRDLSVAITEFSMASPPALESLRKVIPAEELESWPTPAPDDLSGFDVAGWDEDFRKRESAFSLHDAHLSRALPIMMPFISDCGVPSDWQEFVVYSQTAQGKLTQFGIDFWRSRWPHCTMTMSWVFNVIWPSSMTWEYVDWFGVPKISYYFQKRAYEPLHVGATFDELFWPPGSAFRARLFVSNETLDEYGDAKIVVRLYDQNLASLTETRRSVELGPDELLHGGYFEFRIPESSREQVLFLCVDLVDGDGTVLSRSLYTPRVGTPVMRMPYLKNGPWIAQVRDCPTLLEIARESPWQQVADSEHACRVAVHNAGEHPAFQVSLEVPGEEASMRYSDNYFWLEAGETRTIDIRSLSRPFDLQAKAWNSPVVHLEVSQDHGEK
jgi:beta-mannosidase